MFVLTLNTCFYCWFVILNSSIINVINRICNSKNVVSKQNISVCLEICIC